LLCFDFLTLHLYVTHTTGMPKLKISFGGANWSVTMNTGWGC